MQAQQQIKGQQGSMPAFLMNVPRPGVNQIKRAVANQDLPAPVEAPQHEVSPKQAAEQSTLVSEASPEVGLPAVISVKKGRAGCAVVLLRDADVVERCVAQRVAVVDGVCLEMTRHTKNKHKAREEGEEAPPAGIFCAWGVRVERRFPVSTEGLEEFFNSLPGKVTPQGLVAQPPFQESHLSFPLTSEAFAPLSFDIRIAPADEDALLSSSHCEETKIRGLMAAKDRLDALWEKPPPPVARSLIQRIARSQLFPHSGTGGQEHENRAGDKLAELSAVTELLDDIPAGAAFLDLCGGPGAWSQHLLGQHELALRGFGFTLKAGAVGDADDWQADSKDDWYPDLHAHPDWTALWGSDGTGDLLKPGNLAHAAKQLANEQVLLCVADGGFSDREIPKGLLELYFYRLLLAELLMAVSCLSSGGKFVCKLYTSFSESTSALLFLATRMFDSVEIVKPMSSRATGPERYLVASGFRDDHESAIIQAALERSHALGDGASPMVTPLLTPPVTAATMARDQTFSASMTAMVTNMCERQTQALNAVVDRADFLEDTAMEAATCSDPFSQTAIDRREQVQGGRDQKEMDRGPREHKDRSDRHSNRSTNKQHQSNRDIPTPARGGARQNGRAGSKRSQ